MKEQLEDLFKTTQALKNEITNFEIQISKAVNNENFNSDNLKRLLSFSNRVTAFSSEINGKAWNLRCKNAGVPECMKVIPSSYNDMSTPKIPKHLQK